MLALSQGHSCFAQDLLSKQITADYKKRPLGEVLDGIGRQGNFYFSYNALLIKKDSIVNLTVRRQTVKQSLDMLLGDRFQYKQTDNHIIILPVEREKFYFVSGFITDAITGERLPDATIFERQQLASALTDQSGYFTLRLRAKDKVSVAMITVSKGFYTDTTFTLDKGFDQQLSLSLTPADHDLPDVMITQYSHFEQSWIGRTLFSSRMRKQSANLGKFFVEKPIQFSFTPGLGSHGKMSGQVTNKFSFNALGGYTAGVDGFELGGLFNINKKDVRYAQIAGILNITSGGVTGCQVGGIANKVSKSVNGVQISGITSFVGDSINGVNISGINSFAGGTVRGVQISGITNMVVNRDSAALFPDSMKEAMHGAQIAGISNVVNGHTQGFQLAGITNLNRGNITGVQMSGIFNYARRVDGSQIALINIADTVTGYSFGIINIVKHGYHVLSLSASEMLDVSATYKAGSSRLYSILGGGFTHNRPVQVFGMQYGIGKEIPLGRRVAIATELTATHLYPSSREKNLTIIRFEPALMLKLMHKLSIYAGPAVAYCPVTQGVLTDYFPSQVPANMLYNINPGNNMAAWVGWKAGINIF